MAAGLMRGVSSSSHDRLSSIREAQRMIARSVLGRLGARLARSKRFVAMLVACLAVSAGMLLAGVSIDSVPTSAVSSQLGVRGPISSLPGSGTAGSGTSTNAAAFSHSPSAPPASAAVARPTTPRFAVVTPSRQVVVYPSDSSPDQGSPDNSGD